MKLFFTSTVIILFSSFLGISASAEGHKITGQTIITKEQFLSLIDGQADSRLTGEIKLGLHFTKLNAPYLVRKRGVH